MSRIYDKSPGYEFLLSYICRWWFPHAFRRIEYRGVENIPDSGAVIFSPNHANTLMDALAVLSIKSKPVVFVARADIFRKKTARQLLTFFKMLPINRIRDGVDSLKENDAIIEKCVETLQAGIPFCILPEGRHQAKHSLLPLKKGIARIAYETYSRVKDTLPVYIVPVGLEYGDFFQYRSTLLVTVGKPIVLQDFIAEHPDLELQQQERQLLLLLSEKMKENIIYIPTDENYENVWEETNIEYGRNPKGSLHERMSWMQAKAKRITESRKELHRARKVRRIRRERGISLESISERRPLVVTIGHALLLLLALPLFVLSAILSLPALIVTAVIKAGMKDMAFLNSIRFVSGAVVNPIVMLLVCLGLLAVLPWWCCLAIWVLSLFAHRAFYDWVRALQRVISDFRLKRSERELEI